MYNSALMIIEAKTRPEVVFDCVQFTSYGKKRMAIISGIEEQIYCTCQGFTATLEQILILGDTAVGLCEKEIVRKRKIGKGVIVKSKADVKLENYVRDNEGNLPETTKVVADFENLGLLSPDFQAYIEKNYQPFKKEKPQSK
ncbi:hypothetical protein C4559_02915 [Candidatus Microgenomates bacterium]|nr:MAG: hypothetical protein C4559_02915 [Candidatus Microgenomates bacterium]